MERTLVRAKNFVKRHPIAVSWSIVAIEVIYLQYRGNQAHNAFLKEKGLFNEYYHLED